ncbi:MAG: membrane protein insertion efficiency factor YidD [Rhabdochlamydiaceae bacterium]|nr:membrane protein insertion efficiency factor YidD [Rhabdochlamydiaceae bacterium]
MIPVLVHARPGYFEPWGKDADLTKNEWQQPQVQPSASQSVFVTAAEKIISFHQNVLSPVDGPRSHFYPSSSQYMRLAMRKHGFVKGFFLGCDRLMRENNAKWVYKTVQIEDGRILKYDPVPD